MTRKQRQLQWHRASSQWCKRRNGKLYYLGKGTLTRDGKGGMLDDLYDEALAKWQGIAEGLDAHVETRRRTERLADLAVESRLSPDLRRRSVLSARADALEAGATVAQVDAEASLLNQIRSLAHRAVTPSDWQRVAQAVAALETGQPLEERTVAMQVGHFIAFKLRQARAKQRSNGRMINLMLYTRQFRDWLGSSAVIDTINTQTLRAYYDRLLERMSRPGSDGITSFAARDAFQIAKQFVRWLAENSLIPSLPANINSRELIFSMPPGKKVCFTTAEFRNLLAHADDRMKLFLLLMANCGMTQKDIADLAPDEVDWQRGMIRRKRSKTEHVQSVEVVTYRLWQETIELLRRLGQRAGDRVFWGKNKLPLVYADVRPDGKPISVDAIAYAYNRLLGKAGVWVQGKTLTDVRNTSSTMLHNSQFHHLRDLFLGHATRTTAERYYAANYDNRLDPALDYLRQEYLVRELSADERVA